MDKNIEEVQALSNDGNTVPITLDEALTKTGYGKFNYFLIFISGVILTAALLETLGIGYVIPVVCELNLTVNEKGILGGITLVGTVASLHLWGILADTKGRKKVILPTLFLSFVCTTLSSLATNFPLLIILRLLSGFFISGSTATIFVYLGEYHNIKNSSRAIMASSAIFGLGGLLMPGLSWLIINQTFSFYIPIIGTLYKPWRLFIFVCGLPSLFCSLALLKIPESPKFILEKGKQAETIEILKTIYSWNTGKERDLLKISSIIVEGTSVKKDKTSLFNSIWKQTIPIFKQPHLKTTILISILTFWIYAVSYGLFMYFPDIINQVSEYTKIHPDKKLTVCEILNSKKLNSTELTECSETLAISSFSNALILEVFYSVGYAVSGILINKVGKLSIIVVVLFFCGIFGIAAAFMNDPTIGIYFYLILLLCALTCPVINAATIDLYPTKILAMAGCIFLMIGRLGSVIGAYVFGLMIEFYCPSSFIVPGVSLIVCGLLTFLIPNIRVNKVKKPILTLETMEKDELCADKTDVK